MTKLAIGAETNPCATEDNRRSRDVTYAGNNAAMILPNSSTRFFVVRTSHSNSLYNSD